MTLYHWILCSNKFKAKGFPVQQDRHSEYNTSCHGGCTDTNACNYDVTADIDDSSCWFASEGCACENGQGAVVDYLGVCDTDNNNNPPDDDLDGICNVGVIGGCINELACNYDSSATHNNGTCDYNC